MTIYKLLAPALIALLLALTWACGEDDDDDDGPATSPTTEASATATEGTAGADFPQTITDDAGVEVTLDVQPEAIVALAPSFVEVLFAIGAGDAVVAVDENTDEPPEAADIPRISAFEPSVEGIASYEPDLVLIFSDPGGLQDALTQLDIPTALLATPTTVDGVYEQIEMIGDITGHPDEASDIVADMRSDIDAIVAGTEGSEGPTVFFELDPQLFTVGPGSFPHEVLNMLGAFNVADSTGEAYPQMSNEAVIAEDPQVVILADGDFGESADTIAARPGWASISAVTNSRVHPVPGGFLNHASPRLVGDIEELAGYLYPD
jgi:iron complex transport system substrate-binding protein